MFSQHVTRRISASTLEILRAYFRQCGPSRRLIPLLLLLLFIDALLQAAVPALMGYIVDQLIRNAQHFVTHQLPWLIPAAVIACILFYCIAYTQHYLTQHIGQGVGTRFQIELYNHLQRLSADFFQRNQVGEITSRLTNDIGQGVMPLFTQFVVSFWALSVLVVSCITMAYLSVPLLLAFLGVAATMVVITRVVSTRIQTLTREVRDEAGRINARITETIYANPLIRAFAKERDFTESVSRHSTLLLQKSLRTARMTVLFSDVMNTFLALLAPTSLLLIGAYFVGQGFTVGTLVAAYGYWKT
ncbi:MAG TPA: ABC transporter ATP-binding protein, partial [Armatimonadota bacterium]|nr:ABC transporter ATP-binding protein [Armatimonadota bacterium]